jgi:hypothetical protein
MLIFAFLAGCNAGPNKPDSDDKYESSFRPNYKQCQQHLELKPPGENVESIFTTISEGIQEIRNSNAKYVHYYDEDNGSYGDKFEYFLSNNFEECSCFARSRIQDLEVTGSHHNPLEFKGLYYRIYYPWSGDIIGYIFEDRYVTVTWKLENRPPPSYCIERKYFLEWQDHGTIGGEKLELDENGIFRGSYEYQFLLPQ